MKAFVFPGQGSQKKGMGRSLIGKNPGYKDYYRKASDVIGEDLFKIINDDNDDRLNITQFTQPAILTTGIIADDYLKKHSELVPDAVAGHSLGEWTALVSAGTIDFEDAVRLVHLRGRFMSEACPPGKGGMTAVMGLEEEKLEEILAEYTGISIANFNSPGQIVISGDLTHFDEVEEKIKQAGAKMVVRLEVSGPFHSELIHPAADRLKKELEGVAFRQPEVPVYQNVDGMPHKDIHEIKENLIRQITMPVKWTYSVENMIKDGMTSFYEIGHGGVLTGLTKRIDGSVKREKFDKLIKKL